MTFSPSFSLYRLHSVCVCHWVQISPFLQGHQLYRIATLPPNDLILTWLHLQDLISKYGYILNYFGLGFQRTFLGDTFQSVTLSIAQCWWRCESQKPQAWLVGEGTGAASLGSTMAVLTLHTMGLDFPAPGMCAWGIRVRMFIAAVWRESGAGSILAVHPWGPGYIKYSGYRL